MHCSVVSETFWLFATYTPCYLVYFIALMALNTRLLTILLLHSVANGQFPAICNTDTNLESKECCPNDCGTPQRGFCTNFTQEVIAQWEDANSTIVDIIRNAPNTPEKGTVDSRYLWPTIVFEKFCNCIGNFGGYDCSECKFGWTGPNCMERISDIPERLAVRRSFNSLSRLEKERFITVTRQLKNEIGYWSVVVKEPTNYGNGTVTLQNVSTYDFFVFLHHYSARADTGICRDVNKGHTIDFAHEGPVFPVWHRRYLLMLEKEYQRLMNDSTFGLPYWQWEKDDKSPFETDYYGVPSNDFTPGVRIDVNGSLFNDWYAVCDLSHQNSTINSCTPYWRPCDPNRDKQEKRQLQRGNALNIPAGRLFLPDLTEVKIAIAAPSYDAANRDRVYNRDSPRGSFRSRLEGWNRICSAGNCVGNNHESHMHNVVHLWVGGQMSYVSAAANDPIFSVHHCNVDRVFESWIKRFVPSNSNINVLPAYAPVKGGSPGHNRDDFMVPFFPIVRPSEQYTAAEDWGYTYDMLVTADIEDNTINDCTGGPDVSNCPICDANQTCLHCSDGETCPVPRQQPATVSNEVLEVGFGFGLGFGIPLILFILVTIVLSALLIRKKPINLVTSGDSQEMSVRA